jgi:hypothetical protein
LASALKPATKGTEKLKRGLVMPAPFLDQVPSVPANPNIANRRPLPTAAYAIVPIATVIPVPVVPMIVIVVMIISMIAVVVIVVVIPGKGRWYWK